MTDGKIRLIIRADDFGMTHSCNLAIKKCFDENMLTCAAIQAPAPWAQEAAMMAGEHPEWCIGAHLTTLGEWTGYRWRPVLPYDKVSTIVDENGFLHQTVQGFYSKKIDYDQLEREFLAQVDLITNKWGVRLGYVDNHYIDGYTNNDTNYREVTQRVGAKYGLPVSGFAGENIVKSILTVEISKKEETLVRRIRDLTPGLWLVWHHLLLDSLESHALVYANPDDFTDGGVGNHRIAETNALLSRKMKEAILEKNIELIDYLMI